MMDAPALDASHSDLHTPRFALPFSSEEYGARLARVRQRMELAGVDVAVVTSPRDFQWLTGTRVDYDASESPQWLIVWDGKPIAVVRHLEASTHRASALVDDWVEYADAGAVVPFDPVGAVAHTLLALGLGAKRIGINHRVLSMVDGTRLQHLMPDARFADLRLDVVRLQRSPAELEIIRRAVDVNQAALADVIVTLQAGWSEAKVMQYVQQRHAHHLGHDAFETASGATCCQIGPHMMHMHARRTLGERKTRKAREGEGAWLEPGLFLHGYVGCMIRTVWLGAPPTEVKRAVAATAEAFERLVKAVAPGKTAGEVDAPARRHLGEQGFDFQHRSGYSSNERWADSNLASWTPDNPSVLEPGQVYHCPIHVHLPGIGYVGVSEQVLVTETGAEVLGDRMRTCERKLHVKAVPGPLVALRKIPRPRARRPGPVGIAASPPRGH